MLRMPPRPELPYDPLSFFVGGRLGFLTETGATEPAPLQLMTLEEPLAVTPQAPTGSLALAPFLTAERCASVTRARHRTWLSAALDSRIRRCRWHRVVGEMYVPASTSVRVETLTSEFELRPEELDDPGQQWMIVGLLGFGECLDGAWEALTQNPPGRYLWLRITIAGDGIDTPEVHSFDVEYPRLSTREYLPSIFSEDGSSTDFTDRFLGVFDTTQRSIERLVDSQPRYFGPGTAPVEFLPMLATWVGLQLDPSLPIAAKRRVIAGVGRVGALRSTPKGIRELIVALLGMKNSDAPLLLEHFRVRRWLFLGQGRLGEESRLWGAKIVNRSPLGPAAGSAAVGMTQLVTTPDPDHDPLLIEAHRFSVFLPAALTRDETQRRAIERLIESEKPTHTQVCVQYVEPRFRIGIQSMIGFDSVIGRMPDPARLDGTARLGQGVVVATLDGQPARSEIGKRARIGQSTRLGG
jgi:phage tail-like protein